MFGNVPQPVAFCLQDHKDGSSSFQVYLCHIKIFPVLLCYLLIILSLAMGLRPTNKVLRLRYLGQSLNRRPLSRVKITFKRRSVVALVNFNILKSDSTVELPGNTDASPHANRRKVGNSSRRWPQQSSKPFSDPCLAACAASSVLRTALFRSNRFGLSCSPTTSCGAPAGRDTSILCRKILTSSCHGRDILRDG
jgi:hypothetical protein